MYEIILVLTEYTLGFFIIAKALAVSVRHARIRKKNGFTVARKASELN